MVDLPEGEDLRIDLHTRGVVNIKGTCYSGGEALWDAVANLLPVLPAEHGLLRPLFSATDVKVRLGGREYPVGESGIIAALACEIEDGVKQDEIPPDLGRVRAVIAFTGGDSYVEVTVYQDYAQVSVWYFRQEGRRRGTAEACRASVIANLPSHDTYHRGQIACQIRQLSHRPPDTDLIHCYFEAAGKLWRH